MGGGTAALAAVGPRGARSIADELFFSGPGSIPGGIFAGLPPGGFALALGTSWPAGEAGGRAAGGTPGVPVRSEAPAGNDVFGIPIPPEAGQVMLIVLMAFGAMCLVALLFAHEVELPARYRDWRTGRRPRRF